MEAPLNVVGEIELRLVASATAADTAWIATLSHAGRRAQSGTPALWIPRWEEACTPTSGNCCFPRGSLCVSSEYAELQKFRWSKWR